MPGAVCFKINNDLKAKIYPEGAFNQVDWSSEKTSAFNVNLSFFESKETLTDKPSVIVSKTADGEPVLRLVETKRYRIKLEGKLPHQLPRFQNEGNKYLVCSKDSDSVSFQFINYLGKSRIIFDDSGVEKVLKFEVIPDKISYEDDYIRLTEALADVCSELLLDYSGSTSNVFSSSAESQRTLLEQFIFLRQFCYSHNIRSLFEAMKRNPDRRLNQEDEMRPIGMGVPSKHFFTNPFSYGSEWIKIEGAHPSSYSYMPQKVASPRKHDSLDTPANRFIKMALLRFDSLCVDLRNKIAEDGAGMQIECLEEANAIHHAIDDVLMEGFFDEIGILDIMPQNNQVLQKREGYSQLFSAYSMIDLALQLDWKGKDDVYEGESKNVALLYEYWLYFELFRIIKSIDGCVLAKTDKDPFLDFSNGLTVSLKEGKQSLQCFEIEKLGVKVNLYYNRTFSRKEFRTTRYEGSYSRPFRPDYTIAIFPASFTKESEAVRDGSVSYVHFDAKYRISDLTSFIGHGKSETADEEEIAEDKIGSVINTYKLGDLMKMHTYNDAIRRTVGSYVLYPGSYSEAKQGNEMYRLFDEVLPGVGAFSIKPSNNKAGENELRIFIESIIKERLSQDSRLNRLNYYSDIILKDPPVIGDNGLPSISKGCVIGYIRGGETESYHSFLKKSGKFKEGSEFLFYFYAIKGSDVYSHHKDVFSSGFFRFYTNDISITGTYILEPVLCRIVSNELMSRADLVRHLNRLGYETSEENHLADFYYVLRVRVEKNTTNNTVLKIAEVNAQNGNDTFSPHSPKVILF